MDRKEYNKQWFLKNKEKRKEYDKNRDKIENNPQRYKSKKICAWMRYGLIDDYEKVYDIYINTHECMKCSVEISGRNKCMDHDHNTQLYRAVLCKSCNTGNRLDLQLRTDNTTGIKYITKHKDGYRFTKCIKGKTHAKYFTTLEKCIEYKDKYLLEFC